MISIDKCYELLNKNENKYTKEQVKLIREMLYQFAEIIHTSITDQDECHTQG